MILIDESLKANTNTHVILNKVNIIKYRGIKCKGLIVYYLKLLKKHGDL